jgi:hypothetical protein
MSIEMSEFDRSKLISMEKTENKPDNIGNPLKLGNFKGTDEEVGAEYRRRILGKYHFTESELSAYVCGVNDKREVDLGIVRKYEETDREKIRKEIKEKLQKNWEELHPDSVELEKAVKRLNEQLVSIMGFVNVYNFCIHLFSLNVDESRIFSDVLYKEIQKFCDTYRDMGHLVQALSAGKQRGRELFRYKQCIRNQGE